MRTAVCVLLVSAVACEETTTPDELDHAQIVAIRADPPAIAPGSVAVIEVLIAGDDGVVELRPPARFSLPVASAIDVSEFVDSEGGMLSITAPPAEDIDSAREALGLEPGAEVPLIVAIEVDVDGRTLPGDKLLFLGSDRENPTIGGIRTGGGATELIMAAGGELELEAIGVAVSMGEPTLAWKTSVGELTNYRGERPVLSADDPGAGEVVAVVRDGVGGVAWTSSALVVE